jgi:hypothetical protein
MGQGRCAQEGPRTPARAEVAALVAEVSERLGLG